MRKIAIAAFVVLCLVVVYAAVDLRHDHNQIKQIREECRQAHSERIKMAECVLDSTLRRGRQPQLP